MPLSSHFTTGQIARRTNRPVWLIRRIIDRLAGDLPRAGLYRLVPASMLPRIEQELQRLSGARTEEVTNAS